MSAFGSIPPVQKKVILSLFNNKNDKIIERYIRAVMERMSTGISIYDSFTINGKLANRDNHIIHLFHKKENNFKFESPFTIKTRSIMSMIKKDFIVLSELDNFYEYCILKFVLSDYGCECARKLREKAKK